MPLATRESARQLMRAGIEARMVGGGTADGHEAARYSHLKALVVDGETLSLGSANGDARTFEKNHELNTVIADEATTRDFLARVVTPDWAKATSLTAADLAADGWWKRLAQYALEVCDFLL